MKARKAKAKAKAVKVDVRCHQCAYWLDAGYKEVPLARVWVGQCKRIRDKRHNLTESYHGCGKGRLRD